jgi:Domain of unknown function (DUF932)
MRESQYAQFVDTLMPHPGTDATAHSLTRYVNATNALMDLWTAPTQAGIGGTAWAALNAVSEYDQWNRQVRGGDDPETARAARMMDRGNGAIVERAFKVLARDLVAV